jgi:four helix bundle protein
MRDFYNFDAWSKAHTLTLTVYRLTEDFPKSESFGLVASMRRSASSIAMKIAEAGGRDDGEPYASALRQARGMGMELEYQFLLARDLRMIEDTVHDSLRDQIIEVRRMLSGVIRKHSAVPV